MRLTAEINRRTHMTPAQMADSLVDYRTGEIKNARFDLKDSFREFVERVKTSEQFANTGPTIVLSPLASAMLKKYTEESNTSGKEMSFSIRGVKIHEGNKNILVGAYIAPAAEFENRHASQVDIDPLKEETGATKLVNQTNLASYLENTSGSPRGKDFGIGHIHHTKLVKEHWGKPSSGDYQQVERYFQSPEFTEFTWLVITKQPDGKMVYTALRSYRDETARVVHDKIKIFELEESFQELGKNPENQQ
ncbi:MAG TPA: hypothetical protein VLF93_05315 [Candidatus Saccharimonadales bacterium]|nr:hypothetical protein [Candidatus Saccharimonadales bacterium]